MPGRLCHLYDHLADQLDDHLAVHLANELDDHLAVHQYGINLFPLLGRGLWKQAALLIRMSQAIKAFMAPRPELINLSRRGAAALKGALSAPVLLATPV